MPRGLEEMRMSIFYHGVNRDKDCNCGHEWGVHNFWMYFWTDGKCQECDCKRFSVKQTTQDIGGS